MRVSKPDPRRGKPVQPRKETRESGAISPAFAQVLADQEEGQFDFVQAMAAIDEYARKLRESPVYANLLRYKRAVRAILRLLVKEAYGVAEQKFYDPQGRRRQFFLVASIDEKLEELTRDFLEKQTSSLDLVSRLDEIRGLLLDLYS